MSWSHGALEHDRWAPTQGPRREGQWKTLAACKCFVVVPQVIEEAPAPGISPDFRASICDAAIAAARAVGYVNAGTVEFIVDADSSPTEPAYYFCEMNTRLQARCGVGRHLMRCLSATCKLWRGSGGQDVRQTEEQ